MNEGQALTATYLSNFYEKYQNLEHSYANYCNAQIQFKHQYGNKPEDAEQPDIDELHQHVKAVRYWAILIDTSYNALIKQFPILEKEKDKINQLIQKIVNNPYPERNDIRDLVHTLSSIFVDEVMAENLMQAGRVYRSITGGTNEQ